MQWLGRRVQQQARDVERAQFVFEDRLPAFEGQFPESQAPAQGIPVSISLFVVSGQLYRSHILAFCVWPVASCHWPLTTSGLSKMRRIRQWSFPMLARV